MKLVLKANVKEGKNYREVKESNRMMKSQRSNIEREKLKEVGKRIRIDKIIKQNAKFIRFCKIQKKN